MDTREGLKGRDYNNGSCMRWNCGSSDIVLCDKMDQIPSIGY